MKIAVVALGKIGLPLAVQFASNGHHVTGSDTNSSIVDQVNRGEEPFPGEAELAQRLATAVGSGRLIATTNTAATVAQSEVVVIVVPLFVNEADEPDFGRMDSATRDVAQGLKPGTLVSYETTLPVGTTRNRWKPMLEAYSGLVEGKDFHLVFSPERVLTGRIFADLRRYPKLVGGLSAEGAERGRLFYSEVLEFDTRDDLHRPNGVWDMGSAEAAEMTKLAETTYRDVNIGLANQFAMYSSANGIDISKVIEAANSQPYSHIHNPGISVGGHCIPVYPRLYLWNDPHATIVRSARIANQAMPQAGVAILESIYGDLTGAQVGVLGVAYRGNVKETAYSGVFDVVTALEDAGAKPLVHDPMYTTEEIRSLGFEPYSLGMRLDAAILHSDHTSYISLTEKELPGIRVMLDGRNYLNDGAFPTARRVVIGRG